MAPDLIWVHEFIDIVRHIATRALVILCLKNSLTANGYKSIMFAKGALYCVIGMTACI